MRAVQIAAFGGADALTLTETEAPRPGPGEALVRVSRAGVNFIDVYMRSGVYARSDTYRTPLPMTIGMEGAGVVEAVGDGVSDWASGARVAYCLSRGSYAEYAVVPAWRLVPVPESVSFEQAAALMLQGSTAHYLTHSAYRLRPGDVCLVHAGAGGVGQILIQLAKLRGATVIATVGSPEKAKIATARGADHCILYREEDFQARVREITGGSCVHVAYDSVGKDTIHRSIRCVRRRGLCVLFGASSGIVPSIEPIELAEAGSVFFTRPHLADYMADSDEIRGRARDLFAAVEAGRLDPVIQEALPLEAAARAHRMLEARETRGKIVLAVA
ncbi:quinone oxidoreductase family protein [Hansschlegelia zhihuaiae]|uniref:Quinone oxidoreductase n=1 Tax=Hansschlegelia zhihuaiae TaxID=405005 RepID=A0A4Q0MC99_9HYPH|nr:quinone oxidoreductase [Hansschlegelia zhihuaiae]RXF70968.1 quinone oxidoreductase [Hansschlegelia zhihuaiae]